MLMSLIKDSNLPDDFLNCLPDKCSYCGGELEISESLMKLSCKSTCCRGKVISKLYRMLKSLGIDLMSEKDCRIFVEKYDLTNHLSIYDYLPEVDGELFEGFGIEKSNKLYELLEYRKRDMRLFEYIRVAYLPNIEGYEKAIFKGYNNLDKFYDALYSKQVNFIDNLLKTNSVVGLQGEQKGVSIKAYNIYRELIDYEEYLKQCVSTFEFDTKRLVFNIGVIGDLQDNCINEIKERFENEIIGLDFSNIIDSETICILDTIGVKDETDINTLYRDTQFYERIERQDLEILCYTECIDKIDKAIKLVGTLGNE